RMRAITGAGEHLTIIPSMDGTSPVNIDALAETAPRECRFIYDETATFGHDLEAFHKTTFQDPPHGALISEGAAAYRDAETARGAFNTLVGTVGDCANGSGGQLYVGDWNADDTSLHLRPRLPDPVRGHAGRHLLRLRAIGVRHRDDEPRRERAALARNQREVPAMTALPSTSSPSGSGRYSTSVWPGATPRSGTRSRTTSLSATSSATASAVSPCA